MPRTISGTLASILSPARRDIDWTLDLVFPDATAFHFATSPLTSVNGNNYTNDLETVSQIRQTMQGPVDNVSIAVQNRDRVLGLHVAANWQIWRKAQAVIGRYYYQISDTTGARTGTNTWIEMFRGAVQQPNANDAQVTFDIVSDTISTGQIVSSHTEALNCGWVYKDAKTCGYSGGLTTCDKTLKGLNGCDVHSNSHHFGGTEHRYNPDASAPGTGGNDDPGGGGDHHPPCPRLDQYIWVRDPDGNPMVKMVCFLTDDDWIWNPVNSRFYKVASALIVRDEPIWELITYLGAVGFSSGSHPIIRGRQDKTGLAIERFDEGQPVLGYTQKLIDTRAILFMDSGETGDVMRISMDAETDAEKIYCFGDSPDKMIVCHNRKPDPTEDFFPLQ